MPQVGLYVYPWDIEERGIERVAEECQGLGIDTVQIAVVYHAVTAFRPDAITAPLLVRPHGALLLQPLSTTDTGEFWPTVDPSALTSSTATMWAEAFCRRKIAMVAWMVPTHDMATEKDSCLCQVGPFGDSYLHALCPAQERVRDYVIRLVRDVDQRGIFRALELEHIGYGAFRHYRHTQHAKFHADLSPLAEMLLSLCFCPACSCRARQEGLDSETLRRACAAVLRAALSANRPVELTRVVQDDLDAFQVVRASVVESLLGNIRAATKTPLFLSPLFEPGVTGFIPARALGHGERLVVMGYERPVQRLGLILDGVERQGIPLDRVNLAVHIGKPSNPSQRTLASKVTYACRRGVGMISFYNYGLSSNRERKILGKVLNSAPSEGHPVRTPCR